MENLVAFAFAKSFERMSSISILGIISYIYFVIRVVNELIYIVNHVEFSNYYLLIRANI